MTDTEILDHLQESMTNRPPMGGMAHDVQLGGVTFTVRANGFGVDVRALLIRGIEQDRANVAKRVARALGAK